jgi:hypothetical protein
MLKLTGGQIEALESSHPGIKEQIQAFELAVLPVCPRCGSADTADVQVGIIGRTINLNAATTKIKLTPNGPRPGRYFCNACSKFFDPILTSPLTK